MSTLILSTKSLEIRSSTGLLPLKQKTIQAAVHHGLVPFPESTDRKVKKSSLSSDDFDRSLQELTQEIDQIKRRIERN